MANPAAWKVTALGCHTGDTDKGITYTYKMKDQGKTANRSKKEKKVEESISFLVIFIVKENSVRKQAFKFCRPGQGCVWDSCPHPTLLALAVRRS